MTKKPKVKKKKVILKMCNSPVEKLLLMLIYQKTEIEKGRIISKEIGKRLDVGSPWVCRLLRVLKHEGLILANKEGRKKFITLTPKGFLYIGEIIG